MKQLERPQAGWLHRRRIIYSTLVFCATIILYITFNGSDTRIYDTIATSAFSLAGLIISVYVLGASYQDVAAAKLSNPTSSKENEEK